MDAKDASKELIALAREFLVSLADPALQPFIALWPLIGTTPHALPSAAPSSPPVLRWLADIAEDTRHSAAPLTAALWRTAARLPWRQSYTAHELGEDFMRNYAYTEIAGPNAAFASEQIACGFLLLGPTTLYPRHRHDPEEIYVTLSGAAEWLQGDGIWRIRRPGCVIHHGCDEPHAMRTGLLPLLALYLWRGTDLHRKARLDPIGIRAGVIE